MPARTKTHPPGSCRNVTTTEEFRKLALALPEAEEVDHRGRPSFRVRGAIFATLWPEELRGVLKLDVQDQADLVSTDAQTFSLNAWSKQGWTNVNLKTITPRECRRLIEEAWREVAPTKLVRLRDTDEIG